MIIRITRLRLWGHLPVVKAQYSMSLCHCDSYNWKSKGFFLSVKECEAINCSIVLTGHYRVDKF